MGVRVGLAGAGRWAREAYAPFLASHAGVDFAGVWARTPDTAGKLAHLDSVPAFRRYGELLDACDAVVFAVPPAVQADLAMIAAGRRKAVLLGRPIAGDLAGAEELTEVVTRNHAISQVALTWRYFAPVRDFLAHEVKHTRPMGGSARLISGALAAGGPVSAWRIERGVLLDMGVDLLDLLDAALGPVADIRAHGTRTGWVGLLLEHEGGRYSEASLCATASPDEPPRAEIEIFGSGGAAVADCAEAAVPETIDTMIGEFVQTIERGVPHPLDVERGLHLQRLADVAETELLAAH